ncbi:hypothetical protein [Synechococcus sp. CBW1107]|uniref:hypothetical protein n=1 Tax=Synechococcus sp. CBW1107 TaxID=2789857 RepID=UPI002AD426E7|nr:hypothetical protein [Synechococcus sp. CBW1107]
MKANQKTLHRQIRSQFQGKRHIPVEASVFEEGHGRAITWTLHAKQAPEHIRETWSGTSWIVEVSAIGTRGGKPFKSLLKNPPKSAKMGQLPSPDARSPGAQRLPVLLRVD